ncbi:MAG: isochorismate synthase [Paracoccus denitrificans]|nr:MAG: isochorismate synthase [Paracoccus denitrificans]PZO84862.1 MAG: isochorismate synthase [Paracoccus denitrificans]
MPTEPTPTTARGDQPHFLFANGDGTVVGHDATRVPAGPARTLADRVAQLTLQPGQVIAGALPFDRTQDDCLWLAAVADAASPAADEPSPGMTITPEPSARDYAEAVAQALVRMRADSVAKVVLARTLRLSGDTPISVPALRAQLAQDASATVFDVRLPDRHGHPRRLVGATPELLIQKSGTQIVSHPLAGSAQRLADNGRDTDVANALAGSEKDRREHGYVVEYILDTLAPYCRDLGAPRGAEIIHTDSMWHLGTHITGQLRDDTTPSVVLAGLLHPTPAICGVPMAAAEQLIRTLEPIPRDFYAGSVGWSDAQGDGTWYVAIRCAEISGATARLYAGAGVVEGSDPWGEAAETGAKFAALLTAFGLPATAGLDGVLQE